MTQPPIQIHQLSFGQSWSNIKSCFANPSSHPSINHLIKSISEKKKTGKMFLANISLWSSSPCHWCLHQLEWTFFSDVGCFHRWLWRKTLGKVSWLARCPSDRRLLLIPPFFLIIWQNSSFLSDYLAKLFLSDYLAKVLSFWLSGKTVRELGWRVRQVATTPLIVLSPFYSQQ